MLSHIWLLPSDWSVRVLRPGGVQLMTSAQRSLPGRRSVWRLQRCVTCPPVAAGGEVGPKGWRVETVDDWIAAGVQVPKHKEGVVDVLRCDPHHAGLKPVPDPQQVIWSPAHDEGQHDDHRHLQSLHPSLWDDVSATATQVRLTCWESKVHNVNFQCGLGLCRCVRCAVPFSLRCCRWMCSRMRL